MDTYTQAEIKAICQTLLERQVSNIPFLRRLYPEIWKELEQRAKLVPPR